MTRRSFIKRGAIFVPSVFGIFVPQLIRASVVPNRRRNFQPAAASSGAAFSDNFNSGTLSNWTIINGTPYNTGTKFSNTNAGFAFEGAVYNTSCNTVQQYVKFTAAQFNAGKLCYAILRYTDSSSPFYIVDFNQPDDTIEWIRVADATFATRVSIQTISQASADGDSVGFVIAGTGAATTIGMWLNPTGAAPTSTTSWGGSAATQTFTTDPASAVDTGSKVGLVIACGSAHGPELDDFSGGDCP
jgi:hypothetical protein